MAGLTVAGKGCILIVGNREVVMDTFYQILSVIGVAGIIGVGVWVGIIQTKISAHDEAVTATKSDHDLLIRLDEKVSLILQKLERANG
jgi:hypothetical protein